MRPETGALSRRTRHQDATSKPPGSDVGNRPECAHIIRSWRVRYRTSRTLGGAGGSGTASHAHKSSGGTLAVFDLWSRQHASYDSSETKRVWQSAKPDGQITAGSIVHELRQHGIEPRAVEEPAPATPGTGFPL